MYTNPTTNPNPSSVYGVGMGSGAYTPHHPTHAHPHFGNDAMGSNGPLGNVVSPGSPSSMHANRAGTPLNVLAQQNHHHASHSHSHSPHVGAVESQMRDLHLDGLEPKIFPGVFTGGGRTRNQKGKGLSWSEKDGGGFGMAGGAGGSERGGGGSGSVAQ